MAYATQAEMVTAVGEHVVRDLAELADNVNLSNPVASITAALDDASSLADTYLSAYLPISTVPAVLRRAVIDIALYRLGVGRENASEQRKEAFDAALAWLRDVSKGMASLPVEDASADASGPELEAEERLWTRTTMRGLL